MGELENILVKTKAFKDLPKPVLLASGTLGIYYINTENILQDGGEFKSFADNPEDMAQHCSKLLETNRDYAKVVGILSDIIRTNEEMGLLIAGGQTRDWLFSMPVAKQIGVSHISLFKDGSYLPQYSEEDRVEFSDYADLISKSNTVHIGDLITAGSSTYNELNNPHTGWVPMIRNKNGTIGKSYVIVDRNQGGKDVLKKHGVKLISLVTIDEKFLGSVCEDSNRALEYFENEQKWSETYLDEHGAVDFLPNFEPGSKTEERARNFLKKYDGVLQGEIKEELNIAIKERYGKTLEDYQ